MAKIKAAILILTAFQARVNADSECQWDRKISQALAAIKGGARFIAANFNAIMMWKWRTALARYLC